MDGHGVAQVRIIRIWIGPRIFRLVRVQTNWNDLCHGDAAFLPASLAKEVVENIRVLRSHDLSFRVQGLKQ